MPSIRTICRLASLVGALLFHLAPAQAAMETTANLLEKPDRKQLVTMLEREDVQKQLTEFGVDPSDALARVEHMTDDEVVALNNRIAELPAGGRSVSTVELLLIIIIIIILI